MTHGVARSDPWAVLGVERGAGPVRAKAAWRAAALRTHPDRGGSAAAFKQVQAAWATLQAFGEAPQDSGPWTHARAIRHLVALGFDLVPADGDSLFLNDEDHVVVHLDDEEIDTFSWSLPWGAVDDDDMSDVVQLLAG